MKRYVTVKRSATGVTTVTVSLVDGELSAGYSAKTYTGQVGATTKLADRMARQHLQEVREALDAAELATAEE